MDVLSLRVLLQKRFEACRSLRLTGAVVCAVLAISVISAGSAQAEIPAAVVKKSVVLKKDLAEAERVFSIACNKCHVLPDPVKQASDRPDCTNSLSEGDRSLAGTYAADVREGKGLYASHCGRCHDLIAPGLHTREYWSKNLCSSEECFIEKLKDEEEQKVLLYLMSHSKKN